MSLTPLKDLLATHEPFHSRFQVQHFILNKGQMTSYGAFKQCVRELYVRTSGLMSDILEVEIKRGTRLSTYDLDETAKKAAEDKKTLEIAVMSKKIEERFREMSMFWAFATGLYLNVKPAIESQGIDDLDETEWSLRIQYDAYLEMKESRTLSEKTLSHMLFIPEEKRIHPDNWEEFFQTAKLGIRSILDSARETHFPDRPSLEEMKRSVLECRTLFLTSLPVS